MTEICHYITDVAATGNGSYPRNFAMGYDKAKKAALWAAYPLHAYYTAPNASKERAYSADPSLGKTEQMVGGVGAPYNKGHQVPNADRKMSNLANKQISYYSNDATARYIQQRCMGHPGKQSPRMDVRRYALCGNGMLF